jgi:hypothetical protein
MTYTIELSHCAELMRCVAQDLRKQHSVDDGEIIWPYIAREYDIKIKYGNLTTYPPGPATVTFPSEAYYTWLVMKYS